jgi:hypothetical protein
VRVTLAAHLVVPQSHGVDGKLRGVMPDLNSAHAQLLEKARINQANGDL